MLNRPTIDLLPRAEREGSRWDRQPSVRLTLLRLAMILPLLLIGWRVASTVQHGGDELAPRSSPVTVTTRPIPTHGGRVLAADGSVLAHDQQRFQVLVHYRWLESPADRSWLQGQALERLEPHARRDASRLAAARNEVQARRETMLDELATRCHVEPEELARRMSEVQRRVERVVASVQRRRTGDSPADPDPTG